MGIAILAAIGMEVAFFIQGLRAPLWLRVAVIPAGIAWTIIAEKRGRSRRYAELINDRRQR